MATLGITQNNSEGLAPPVKPCVIDVSILKERYLTQQPTCKIEWPKHNVSHYVKLALVEKEDVTLQDEHLNEITKLTLKGEIDGILKNKRSLNDLKDIFHYENKPCPRLILIMGGPGIGKTTLANKICIQWARDGFLADEFDAIINIPLRSVQERSFETVLQQHVGEKYYPMLKDSSGSRCLLILEGLDEMELNHRKKDVTLIRLIKENTLLEKAKILITSRPHACKKLVVDRRVEVVGFGDKEIREFVEHSFPNDVESVEEFMKQLTVYPQLHRLCYVPLNLVMIIDIFRFCHKKLPSTLTELYRLFIVMILQKEIEKGHSVKKSTVDDNVEVTLCKLLAGTSKEVVGIVYLLGKLAYHAFFKSFNDIEEKEKYDYVKRYKDPKIIFTESDLTKSGIEVTNEFDGFGLLKVTHTHQLPIDIVTYNFLHLTVQEFLCSLYMSTLSQQEQLNLLSEHFSEYPNVVMFLCGLTGLASKEMFKFVYLKLTSSEASSLKGDPYVVTAVRCVYEGSHSNLSPSTAPFTLDMSYNTLLPYDCLCLSWLLLYYPVSQLKMDYCHIKDTGAKLLVKHYPNNNSTGQLLEVLNLGYNDLTIAGLENVIKMGRTSWTTLKVLNVDWNKIGDDGISMISEELQHNNSLIELSFRNCGLSVKGFTVISKLLMDTCMIKELCMSYNDFSDDSITTVTTALDKKRITKLELDWCSITLTGATSIATLLSVNNSIRELYLLGNPITKDGACLILQSAVNNKACLVDVQIEDEYKNDEVQAMMKILEHRRKMRTNVVDTTSAAKRNCVLM